MGRRLYSLHLVIFVFFNLLLSVLSITSALLTATHMYGPHVWIFSTVIMINSAVYCFITHYRECVPSGGRGTCQSWCSQFSNGVGGSQMIFAVYD